MVQLPLPMSVSTLSSLKKRFANRFESKDDQQTYRRNGYPERGRSTGSDQETTILIFEQCLGEIFLQQKKLV